MSWWWIRRRPDDKRWTIASIGIPGFAASLIGLLLLSPCIVLVPPYGAIAVLAALTGLALLVIAKVLSPRTPGNQTPAARVFLSMRNVGLTLIVGGFAVCLVLLVFERQG